MLALLCTLGAHAADPYAVDRASYLGGGGNDAIYGSAIAADGSIILAGVLSGLPPGCPPPALLLGATSTSPGVILRLSADGGTVLSAARVGSDLWDLALGPDGTIHVALGSAGAAKLTPSADAEVWSRIGSCHRIDVGSNGDVAMLSGVYGSHGSTATSAGTITVVSANGTLLGTQASIGLIQDIAIDGGAKRVAAIGYKQYNSPVVVQIPYLRTTTYTGTEVWKNWDFSVPQAQSAGLLADTRGHRVVLSGGRFHALIRCDGGNHLITNPTNIGQGVPFTSVTGDSAFPGGGTFSNFANASGAKSVTIVAVVDAGTGAWVRGVRLCTRIASSADPAYGKMNSYNPSAGELAVDGDGRVALIASAASGGGTGNTTPGLPYSHDPCTTAEYGGGPSLTVLSNDLTSRLACIRICSGGSGYTLAMRRASGSAAPSIVFAGSWVSGAQSPQVHTIAALQASASGASDGFFGLIANTGANNPPLILVLAASPAAPVLP